MIFLQADPSATILQNSFSAYEGILTSVISSLFGGTGLYLIDKCRRIRKLKKDESRILKFLHSHRGIEFDSISMIASALHLSEERVETICGISDGVPRNEIQNLTWELNL